jgi:hypothetical protein
MRRHVRFTRPGCIAGLFAALYPTLQDVATEALANLFTDQVRIPASGWLAIPLSLMASAALEKLPGLLARLGCFRRRLSWPPGAELLRVRHGWAGPV